MSDEVTLGMKHEALQTYESGAKRSDRTGKGRFDLISPHGLRRLALRYEAGALDKGERNWEKGFGLSRCIDAAFRHLNQYNGGDRAEDHLAAVAWQCFAMMHFEEEVKAGRLTEEVLDVRVISNEA